MGTTSSAVVVVIGTFLLSVLVGRGALVGGATVVEKDGGLGGGTAEEHL